MSRRASGPDDDRAPAAGHEPIRSPDREDHHDRQRPSREAYPTGADGRAARARGNGPAVTALVLGILALVSGLLSFLVITIFLAVLFGGLAVVFAVAGFRRARNPLVAGRGMATAGLVLGLLGVVIAILFVIGVVSFFNDPANRGTIQQLQNQFNQQTQ